MQSSDKKMTNATSCTGIDGASVGLDCVKKFVYCCRLGKIPRITLKVGQAIHGLVFAPWISEQTNGLGVVH